MSDRRTLTAAPRPSKDRLGRARPGRAGPDLRRPSEGPLSGALGAVQLAFAARLASKCACAASTASGVMAHEVFFTSGSRVNSLRRYARSALGSTPRSSASAFGVMALVMLVTPFRGFGVSFMPTSSHTRRPVSRGRGSIYKTFTNRTGVRPPPVAPPKVDSSRGGPEGPERSSQTVYFQPERRPRKWRVMPHTTT